MSDKSEARQARSLRGLSRSVAKQRAEAQRGPVSRGPYRSEPTDVSELDQNRARLDVHLVAHNPNGLVEAAKAIARTWGWEGDDD